MATSASDEPSQPQPRATRSRGRAVAVGVAKFALGAGIVAVLLWWLGPSWSDVAARLELRPGYLLVGFLGTLLATFVTAARWKLLTEVTAGGNVPYSSFFHYLALTRFLGQFSSVLVMDLVGRSVALRAAGNRRGLGLLITPLVLERILDLLIPLAMLGWAWAVHTSSLAASRWILFGATTVLLFAGAIPLLSPLTRAGVAVYAKLRRLRHHDAPKIEPITVSMAIAARVSLLSILRYMTVVLQFFGMGAAAGIVLDGTNIFSAAPLAMLSGLIGITPGGLGIQEAGWAASLHWLGHDDAAIAVFVLATRALIIVNFGVLSALSFPFGGRRRPAEG
jgi:uncharacterized membrane protein YbhN (UPF0104 family)